MEEKKNNRGIIWLIIILIVLVLGLIGFLVYDKVLLEEKNPINNDETITTTITTTTTTFVDGKNSIKGLKLTESFEKCANINEDKCVLYKSDDFEIYGTIDMKNSESWGSPIKIYLNNKLFYDGELMEYYLSIQEVDSSSILMIEGHMNGSDFALYDNKGVLITDFSEYVNIINHNTTKKAHITQLYFKDNKFYLTIDFSDYDMHLSLCEEFSDDDVVQVEKSVNYLGNGKFDSEKIISNKTLREIFKDYQYKNCQEVRDSLGL